MFRIQVVRYISLLILFVLTALSYHPTYSNVVIFEKGENPLMPYIIIMAVVTFLLHFSYHKWLGNHFIRVFIIYMLICVALGFFLLQMDITRRYDSDARWIAMSCMFLAIGYNSGISRKQLVLVVLVYSVSVAVVTYLQMMQHSGGFVIVDQYLDYGKNTLGAMCAVSCIALLVVSFEEPKRYLKIIERALYLFVLVLCISIRARAAFLTIFVISAYCLFKQMTVIKLSMKNLSKIVFGCIFVAAIVIITPQLYDSIVDYVSSALIQHHEDDLVSGREKGWEMGLTMLNYSPLFGNIMAKIKYDTILIHNYLLRVIASYGLIGALPLSLLYLFLSYYVVKNLIKTSICSDNIGYAAMSVVLVISLVEPTFPYSPGTGVIMPFFLLGWSLFSADSLRGSKPKRL